VDLKELVDLLKGEPCRLDVEVIDDGHPDKIQYSEDDVEPPADIGNSCSKSAGVLKHYFIKDHEPGVRGG
jgi:hypothetical protein